MNAYKHIKLSLSLFTAMLLANAGQASAFEARAIDVIQESDVYFQADSAQALPFKQFSRDESTKVRSRSDVIREVKQRYNAEVLRISLNERRMVYEVRVLMPSGKVRNLKISAKN